MKELIVLEWSANAFYLVSVLLAARNSIHTWWLGLFGTVLFGILFYKVQLYADVTLMVFFVLTSIYGWWYWCKGAALAPITTTKPLHIMLYAVSALVTLLAYGYMLHTMTDAYAPFVDSAVLMFSVLAQLLLMNRRIETWWFWIIVNTLAVPLYFSRELYPTAVLYIGFWFNAIYGYLNWRRELAQQKS